MTHLRDQECSPFNASATGILGTQRNTMLSNVLLKRPGVGQPLHAPSDQVFGQRELQEYDVKHALGGWTCHLPVIVPCREPVKDFRQINRSAILHGIVDAPSIRDFGKMHTATPSDNLNSTQQRLYPERPHLYQPPPCVVPGLERKSVDPMALLLSHEYQNRWFVDTKLNDLHDKAVLKNLVPVKTNYRQWYPNRTSMLRTVIPPIGVSAPPWRMPRFLKKAKPHLCTFRSEGVKTATIQANAFDHVGREGSRGQGIITKAGNRQAGVESTPLERGFTSCPRSST